MRKSEKRLYELEAEVRPNRYVTVVLAVISLFIIAILLLNEFDVFKVNKIRMRIAVFAGLIILLIPGFVVSAGSGLKDVRTKYVMIACAGTATAVLCTVLSFHATLVTVLPILLAAQYPSVKLSRFAIICSLVSAALAPVIGYVAGLWDTSFLEALCRYVGWTVVETPEKLAMSDTTAVLHILMYTSLPHTLIVLAMFPLLLAIARGNEKRLKNQIQVLHMSESDALTGTLNRNRYDRILESEADPAEGNVAVIYADANGLHRLNNEHGHAAGDRLLICVAENMRKAFGNENVYRTGGDEFISIVHGMTYEEVQKRLKAARTEIEKQNYSISAGIEYAQPPCTLPALVTSAEAKMMLEKKAYHIVR